MSTQIEMIETITTLGCEQNTPAVANACIQLLYAIVKEIEFDEKEARIAQNGMQDIADSLNAEMVEECVNRI